MKKRYKIILLITGIVAAVVLITVPCVYYLWPFRKTFITACENFKGPLNKHVDCEMIWGLFEQAYDGRHPCGVPVEAYQPLLAAVPFKLECNQMMFWSKTDIVVHDFTKKSDCYVALEDTLLGLVLNRQTWCGDEGSSGTFTNGCPACESNAVRSFWNAASAAFADAACGDVTVMLNGDDATPFDSSSVFARIELPRLRSPKVTSLTVVLVTTKNAMAGCEDASLKDLQGRLEAGIKYSCKEVSEAQIYNCMPNPPLACTACW